MAEEFLVNAANTASCSSMMDKTRSTRVADFRPAWCISIQQFAKDRLQHPRTRSFSFRRGVILPLESPLIPSNVCRAMQSAEPNADGRHAVCRARFADLSGGSPCTFQISVVNSNRRRLIVIAGTGCRPGCDACFADGVSSEEGYTSDRSATTRRWVCRSPRCRLHKSG